MTDNMIYILEQLSMAEEVGETDKDTAKVFSCLSRTPFLLTCQQV